MEAKQFLCPPQIFYGENALELAGDKLASLGKKALIVTDKMMVQLGYISNLTKVLEDNGVEYSIYDGANAETQDVFVDEGLDIYKKDNCEFLIALGGGSPIDTMKAIGAMATNPGKITDYMGKVIPNETPKMVAIPTTAGTGSEATQFTIVADTKNDVKMLLKGPNVIPDIAIDDPLLTMSVPPKVTAATGIDALTHAIEAYTSVKNQPLTDTYSLAAIKRISENLRKAVENGKDMEARSEMMLAALEAGMAFNNSSVTIVHGMSRPIGAIFHVPHGVSNAILLPACLEFAMEGCPERFAKVAEAMGVDTKGLSDLEASKKGVEAVAKLCSDVQIPAKVSELGVDAAKYEESLDKMASDALASGSPNNTMKQPTKEDLIDIYKKLI